MSRLSDTERFLIDFNVQDVAIALGLDMPLPAGAHILGVAQSDMSAYIAEADAVVAQAAAHLLESDPAIKAMAAALSSAQQVMAIGDSITTYRYSYARLLQHLLPESEVINHGYSGYTSNQGLELTHTRFVQAQPDVVFVKYGVNDCKLFAGMDGRTLVTLNEYRENMIGIVKAFQRFTDADVVLLTPTPVVSEIVANNPDFDTMHLTWDNTHLARSAEVVREVSETHQTRFVDLFSVFGANPSADLYLPDGLHPNLAGQKVILKAIADTYLK